MILRLLVPAVARGSMLNRLFIAQKNSEKYPKMRSPGTAELNRL